MIYVIVKHSGYVDDGSTNVFATISQNVAEDKLAELEAYNDILIKASKELQAFAEEFEEHNAPQFPEGLASEPIQGLHNSSRHKEWRTKYEAYMSMEHDVIKQKTGEIAAKHWVRREELYSPFAKGYDYAHYSIQKVESD
jgi:hypothetical protein